MRALGLGVLVLLVGCPVKEEPAPSPAPSPTVTSSAALSSARDTAIDARFGKLETRMRMLEFDKIVRDSAGSVTFDPQDSKNYQGVHSTVGQILFVLERVQPYLDGFTVTFRIGNPTSASLGGIKGKVFWGPLYGPTTAAEPMQSKEFDDPIVFAAGSWTNFSLNIAPATAAQVRQIMVTPEFNQVMLRRPQQ